MHLAYVAAVTERLELGTGIVILPQRNLLVRVKQAASLAVLSGGRLLFGIGAGYLERSERGGRTDEYQGAPRIVVGGHSPAAFRRAVARGHGWFGNGRTPDDLVNHLAGLRKAATEVERPAHLGRLEITFMQVDPVEVDAARRHADRLLIYPLPLEEPDKVGAFGRAARQPLSTLTSIEPNISPLSHSLFINSSSVDT